MEWRVRRVRRVRKVTRSVVRYETCGQVRRGEYNNARTKGCEVTNLDGGLSQQAGQGVLDGADHPHHVAQPLYQVRRVVGLVVGVSRGEGLVPEDDDKNEEEDVMRCGDVIMVMMLMLATAGVMRKSVSGKCAYGMCVLSIYVCAYVCRLTR